MYLKSKGYELPKDPNGLFWPHKKGKPVKPEAPGNDPAFFKAEDSEPFFTVEQIIGHPGFKEKSPWFVHLSLLPPHPPFNGGYSSVRKSILNLLAVVRLYTSP